MLGRTYEYFIQRSLARRAIAAASSTRPRSVTRLLVEMLEPYEGRVLDPACGSGGLFIQSGRVRRGARRSRRARSRILGQENNQATWRIAR